MYEIILFMKLEEEIQSKFKDNYHKLLVNIVYSYSWAYTILRKQLKTQNLTTQQFNILRILRGQHPQPATVNLLKERMLDKMSDASRIVERLIKKKLVVREINQKDRRAVDIYITEKGLELLKKLDKMDLGTDVLRKNLSPEETDQLNRLLDQMRGKE